MLSTYAMEEDKDPILIQQLSLRAYPQLLNQGEEVFLKERISRAGRQFVVTMTNKGDHMDVVLVELTQGYIQLEEKPQVEHGQRLPGSADRRVVYDRNTQTFSVVDGKRVLAS